MVKYAIITKCIYKVEICIMNSNIKIKIRGNIGSALRLSLLLILFLSLTLTVNAAEFKQFNAKEFAPQEKAPGDFAQNPFKQNNKFKIPDSAGKNTPATACPGALIITSGPSIQFLDNAAGSIRVNWNTNIASTSELSIYRYDGETGTNVVETNIRNVGEQTRSHSLNANNLVPGSHFVEVTSKTIATQQCAAKVVTEKVNGGVFIQYPHGPQPKITFESPTPANGAALYDKQIIIRISSDKPLQLAKIHLVYPNNTQITSPMTRLGATSYSYALKAQVGSTTYDAYVLDGEEQTNNSQSRFFTINPTQLTFVDPTPVNGASLSESTTQVTIKINSNRALQNATLKWKNEAQVLTGYAMTATSQTEFYANVPNLNHGQHSYFVEAVDNDGDITNTKIGTLNNAVPRFLTISSTTPQITFVYPTPTEISTTQQIVTIAISSNEPLSNAVLRWYAIGTSTTVNEYQIPAINSTTFSRTFISLPRGTYTYQVIATDLQGDVNTTRHKTLVIAPTLPEVNFDANAPQDQSITTSRTAIISFDSNEALNNATLEWIYSNQTKVNLQMTRINATRYAYMQNNLPRGNNYYSVTITDLEGDTTRSQQRRFTINPTPPIVSLLNPTPASGLQTTERSFTIRINSNEGLTTKTLVWNYQNRISSYEMQATSADTYEYNITNLQPGTHTYKVYATDGEQDTTTSEERTLIVQATPPQITFVDPTPVNGLQTTQRNFTIKINSSEPLANTKLYLFSDQNYVSMSETTANNYEYNVSTLSRGQHNYHVEVTDIQGDTATSETRTLEVQPTPPIITFLTPTPEDGIATANRSASVKIQSNEELLNAVITWIDPNNTQTTASMQRLTPTEYIYTTANNLPRGQHNYSIIATDKEYDIATIPIRTLTILATPPQVTFISPTPQDGVTVLPNVSVTIKISSNEPLTSAILNLVGRNNSTPATIAMTKNTNYEFEQTIRSAELGENNYTINAIDAEGDSATTATRTINVQEHQLLADQAQQWDIVNHFEQGGWHYECAYDNGQIIIAGYREASVQGWYCDFGAGTGFITKNLNPPWLANIPYWSSIDSAPGWDMVMKWTSNYSGPVNIKGWYNPIVSSTSNITFWINNQQIGSALVANLTNTTYSFPTQVVAGDNVSARFGQSPTESTYQFKMQITT